jgi:hypothetical protein
MALVFAGTAQAQIDSHVIVPRVFNDFPGSTLITASTGDVNTGFLGSAASVTETGFVDDGPPNFANRHDVLVSRDGLSPHIFGSNDSWEFSSIFNLSGGPGTIKEAGIRVNSPITGDGIFLIKTNGEIAAFAGGFPFFSFSAGMGVTNDYVPGTPILLGMRMSAFGDGGGPGDNLVEYFIDRSPGVAGGEESSGFLAMDNTEGAPLSYTLGGYVQTPPSGPTDSVTFAMNDIRFVPEPSTMLMSALGALAIGFIRRRK